MVGDFSGEGQNDDEQDIECIDSNTWKIKGSASIDDVVATLVFTYFTGLVTFDIVYDTVMVLL